MTGVIICSLRMRKSTTSISSCSSHSRSFPDRGSKLWMSWELCFVWFDTQIHPERLPWNLQSTHLERNMIFQTSITNPAEQKPPAECVFFHFLYKVGCRYLFLNGVITPHLVVGEKKLSEFSSVVDPKSWGMPTHDRKSSLKQIIAPENQWFEDEASF